MTAQEVEAILLGTEAAQRAYRGTDMLPPGHPRLVQINYFAAMVDIIMAGTHAGHHPLELVREMLLGIHEERQRRAQAQLEQIRRVAAAGPPLITPREPPA